MPIQARQAAQVQGSPYAVSPFEPLKFEIFEGVNTVTTRPGVDDKQAFWLDGFMPLAPRNLRTLPDIGSTFFTRSDSNTIVFFDFYVLNGVSYMVVFQSDGSATQVNMSSLATTTILPATTIAGPSITTIGTTQWNQQFLIICAAQTNGYWVWDGMVLYQAGTLSPQIVITNAGQGYSSPPAVFPVNGSGSLTSLVGIISGGFVTGVSFISPGTGFVASDHTVSFTFVGGNPTGSLGTISVSLASVATVSGSGATFGTPSMVFVGNGLSEVVAVPVVTPGSNYSNLTQIAATGGVYYPGNPAVLTPAISNGSIASVIINSGGLYYATYPPTGAVATDPNSSSFTIASVSIIAVGANYSPNAVAVLSGGSSPTRQGQLGLHIVNGSINSVAIVDRGLYGGSIAPTVSIVDTAIAAQGYAVVMPFGIQGTSVETYQGYVWLVQGAVLYNSAPGSVSDFASTNGGGNKTSASSKLRIGYTRLIAANGFLYTIADSSIDIVSGVQTSGTVATTTYSWLNADPEVGSPYPQSVMTWGRGLFLANAYGVHVMYGSEAQKISEPLDGVYNTVAGFGNVQLSSAEHLVYGRKIAINLVPIVDPVKNTQVNKLLCFDGKRWFASEQSKNISYVKHREFNSTITCFGTDGTTVFPVFNTPSAGFTKTAQTKLWDAPGGYQYDKIASRFWSIWDYNSSVTTSFTLTVDALDNRNSTTQQGYTVSGPSVTGLFRNPAQAIGQQGPLMGFTLKTNCADAQLISAMIQPEEGEYAG